MQNKRHFIVTGAAGFIGSHIARRLIQYGQQVTVLDNLSTGKQANIPQGAEYIKMDLGQETDYAKLQDVHCDILLHLAGQSSGEASFKDPLTDLRSHIMSTFWLLEWCRRNGALRFLYASSMSVYGNPTRLPVNEEAALAPLTFYAAAKSSAEAYIKLYQSLGVNTTILRLFSIYGPGQDLDNKMQGIVSIYLSYMLEDRPLIVRGSPERFRDFLYIDDVVDAWLACIDNPLTYGNVYNLGSGKQTKVAELIKGLEAALGRKNYPVQYAESTPGDQFGLIADIAKISKTLGWRPKVDLQTGLNQMVKLEKERLKH